MALVSVAGTLRLFQNDLPALLRAQPKNEQRLLVSTRQALKYLDGLLGRLQASRLDAS